MIFWRNFFGGIFLEEFFGRNFLGGFFWEEFLEDYFGRNFFGGCFVRILGGILRLYLAHLIQQPIFQILNLEYLHKILFTCLINSRARHSAIHKLKSCNLFYFFLNLKEASKCVLGIIKKIKTKISS